MSLIKPFVVPATITHAHKLAPIMREIDKQEIWASGGLLPQQCLEYSVNMSEQSFTVFHPAIDNPIMMFGIGRKQSLLDNYRQVWMLASDEIKNIKIPFLRQCGDYITLMGAGSTVYNYVLEGNNVTLKWLNWLGFTIMNPKPHGLIGRNFHYVKKEISCAESIQSRLH